MKNRLLPAAALMAALPAALPLAPAAPASAEVLIKPDMRVSSDAAEVVLVFLNEGAAPLQPPERIEAVMTAAGGAPMPVVLVRQGSGGPAAPGGFVQVAYDVVGERQPVPGAGVTIALPPPWGISAPLAVVAAAPAAEAEPPGTLAAPAMGAPAAAAEAQAALAAGTAPEESFEDRSYFSTYRPVYAVLGLSPANAKLQFSFKYALVDPDGDAAMRWSFLRGVYFGYTQTMFWDLAQESSPFRSIDFKPEIFYRYRSDSYLEALDRPAFNVQTGIRHLSNGREEPASVSFNQAYVEPSFTLPVGEGYHLTAAPRAWLYFGDLEDNPDIDEFRGHTSFRLSLTREDGARLEARTIGLLGGRGSFQTDLSYPITGGIVGDLNLRAHAQLFTGYGDNLLEYDRKATRLRIGISLAD